MIWCWTPRMVRRAGPGGAATPARCASAGVTLIELSVVLVIIAILGTVVAAASGLLQSAILAGRAKGASDQIAAAIRTTRQRAITNAQDHCIQLSSSTSTYQIFEGTRSGTTCSGTAIPEEPSPVALNYGATVGANVAFRFTPVSTVDPVGPTDVTVTTGGCSVTVTVTPEGGVRIPGTNC